MIKIEKNSPAAKTADGTDETPNSKAKAWFYERHHRFLIKTARRYLTKEDSEDIVQNAFIKVFAKADQFKPDLKNIGNNDKIRAHVQGWLGTIVFNEIKQFWREKNKSPEGKIAGGTTDDEPSDIPMTYAQITEEKEKAEESVYGVPELPETSLDLRVDEIIKKVAHKILSEQHRIIYLAWLEKYETQEKSERMRKLDIELNRKRGTRYKIIRRSQKKICKYVEGVARKLLSDIEFDVFLSLLKQYEKEPVEKKKKDEKKPVGKKGKTEKKPVREKGKAEREAIEIMERKKKILRELEDKHRMTEHEINKIYEEARQKVKNYLMSDIQN
ncbi:MAG: sigma-70 family RNA polymerase sigma factor [Acidobacteriota bacterium]|nr:sigma-70 family RNA polymerase sigma factor [Acidobacteriota bacterium]